MEIRLSILVPICNVEKYLDECLNSIEKIKIKELEIICLNDGSTDSSSDIINRHASNDSRIVVIDKANTGYGDTLNRGLHMARGTYIGIVESDDIVVEGSFEKLLDTAEKKNLDVIKGNYNLYYDVQNIKKVENFSSDFCNRHINPRNNWKVFLSAPAIWSGIYKKNFLKENQIVFVPSPGASYQDTAFMFKIWCSADSVYIIDLPVINYRQTNVASSSNSNRKLFDIFVETNEMQYYLIKKDMRELLALCTRVKFQSFAWNLSRLNGDARGVFLIKMYYDLRQDFYDGYIEKKYWEEDNWGVIFNILTNIENVIRDNVGMTVKKNFEITRYLDGILVFDDCGEEFLREIEGNNLIKKIDFKRCKEEGINAIEKDSLVLINADEDEVVEKIGFLEKNYYKNYIVI